MSPRNEVLLLHRVQNSTAFASAHVFPGGNVEPEQDGPLPSSQDPGFHEDGLVYRLAAIRECFEESGILLARRSDGGGMLRIDDAEREAGRKAIHSGTVKFLDWLMKVGGVPDTGEFMLRHDCMPLNTLLTSFLF